MDESKSKGSQLLTAKSLGKMLSLSPRMVWRLRSAGKLPKAVSVGGNVRWVQRDIDKWIGLGCPNQEEFGAMGGQEMISKTQRAGSVRRTAPQTNQLYKPCHHCASPSSGNLREEIGELLLVLQRPLSRHTKKMLWGVFDCRLRQYVEAGGLEVQRWKEDEQWA